MLRTIRRAAAARLRVLHCLAAVLRRVTFWGVDPGRWCAAVLRTGRVVDPSEESRGVLRTLAVRAFGEGADDKYWKKGNLLLLKAVTVRPDEKCLKVTEEAIIEVVEKVPKWKLPKNAKARS